MAVNEDVSAYSVTAASNTPAGGDTVGPDLDNHLRDIKKNERRIAEHFITVSDENFKGRIKSTTSGSTHTLSYFADSGDMEFVAIDDSANAVTLYIDDVLMGAAAKNFNKQTTTASAQTSIDLSVGTVGGQLLAETATASARSRLDLGTVATQDVGTSIGDIPQLVTGSATSMASLPSIYGDKLLGTKPSRVVSQDFTGNDTYTSTNTLIPGDNTIPQISEGDVAIELTYTPDNAANILDIEMGGLWGHSVTSSLVNLALFQDSAAASIAVAGIACGNNSDATTGSFRHWMTAGGTSPILFTLRYGPRSGTAYRNGSKNNRLFGGLAQTYINIIERK